MSSVRGISGLVPWFGGKRAMASLIVDQVCWRDGRVFKPGIFVEPFCGSCAVSLAMPEISTHIVNDLHRDLINLARVLISDRGDELIARAKRVLTSSDVFGIAHDRCVELERCVEVARPEGVDDDQLEWALCYLISAWLGKGGVAGTSDRSTKAFASRYGPGGGSPAVRWFTLVRSLAALRRRMRTVVVEHTDAIELLGKVHDTPKTAIYCDPPYIGETREHGAYRHDFSDAGGMTMFAEQDDHHRLAEALRRFEHARIVLSYEDHPRLGDLYPGWDRVVLDRPKNMSNTGSSARVREVLLVNGVVRA